MDIPRGTVEWLKTTLSKVLKDIDDMRESGKGNMTDTFRLAFLSGHVSALNNAILRELERDNAIAEREMISA